MTWLDRETPLVALGYLQLRRLVARSRCRPVATAILVVGVATCLFALQMRRPKLYEAEVGLLLTEGAFESDGRPRSRGELRAFVRDVAFADARLNDLIEKHSLAQRLGMSNTASALDRMRKLIEVQTWADYFEGSRQSLDPPRSVRVTIGFSAPDPALALAVALDLGELLAETQSVIEKQNATARVDALRGAAESTTADVSRQRELFDQMGRVAGERADLAVQLRLQELAHALEVAEKASRSVSAQLVDAQLRLRAVQQVGSRVQVVDRGAPAALIPTKSKKILRQALLALVTSLPLAIVLIGAFDPTIRDEQDIRRTGLRWLGRVPRCDKRLPEAGV